MYVLPKVSIIIALNMDLTLKPLADNDNNRRCTSFITVYLSVVNIVQEQAKMYFETDVCTCTLQLAHKVKLESKSLKWCCTVEGRKSLLVN